MALHEFSGRTLDNRYTLVRRIGHGGMATVYEALDHQLDKRVAVKVLNPELTLDGDNMARFRQEARTAAKIRHPHLVDVTDQGYTNDGLAYFVMELLEGESLGDYIQRASGPTLWVLALEMVVQICDALHVAHEHGVIHRDIKPGNCFLEQRKSTGQFVFVKVLDLGIAKVRHDDLSPRDPRDPMSTRDSQGVPGTPEYMAPETARGLQYDRRVDIYAVGIVMYRLLTGQLPFFSPSPFATLEMHCNKAPRPPREINPSIPDWLERIVLTAMAKEPVDRWATAGDLAAALRRGREQDPGLLQPSEEIPTQQMHRPGPRRSTARRLFFACSCLGGLTGAAAMFLVLMLFESQGDSAPPPRPPDKVTADKTVTNSPTPEMPTPETPTPAKVDAPPQAPVPAPPTTPVLEDTTGTNPDSSTGVEAGEPPPPDSGPAPGPGTDGATDPEPPTRPEPAKPTRDVVDTQMFNQAIKRARPGIVQACNGKIGMFENQVTLDVTLELNERGPAKAVNLAEKYASESVGKCVKAELGRISFGALISPRRVFRTTIKLKSPRAVNIFAVPSP